MDWKTTTDLVNILAWPVLLAVALLAYHKPLSAFLVGLSGRLTKLSAFDVSVELAALPDPPAPWSDRDFPESSMLTTGEVSSTALMTLFNLTTPQVASMNASDVVPWDYLVVDIKNGKFWLISRLFIFTVFLKAMRGVKCIVFVESKGEHTGRLIGLALPDDISSVLGEAYPWLEKALKNAMINQNVIRLHRFLDANSAGNIIRTFIEDSEMRKTELPDSLDDWTQLGGASIWEHTRWLTLDLLNAVLRRSFFEWDSSRHEEHSEIPTEKRVKELLHHRAPFVAVVNSRNEFQRLLDRQKLAAMVAEAIADR